MYFTVSALYNMLILFICVAMAGCYEDVTYLVDRKCSGRRQCEIPVPNSELDATSPCFKELKTYLQAGYDCVKGK